MLGIEALCFLFVPRFIAFCLGFVCCERAERGDQSFLGCGLFS